MAKACKHLTYTQVAVLSDGRALFQCATCFLVLNADGTPYQPETDKEGQK